MERPMLNLPSASVESSKRVHPKLGLSEEVHGVISGSGEILSFQHPRGFLIVGE